MLKNGDDKQIEIYLKEMYDWKPEENENFKKLASDWDNLEINANRIEKDL